jgi:hypothetical protein
MPHIAWFEYTPIGRWPVVGLSLSIHPRSTIVRRNAVVFLALVSQSQFEIERVLRGQSTLGRGNLWSGHMSGPINANHPRSTALLSAIMKRDHEPDAIGVLEIVVVLVMRTEPASATLSWFLRVGAHPRCWLICRHASLHGVWRARSLRHTRSMSLGAWSVGTIHILGSSIPLHNPERRIRSGSGLTARTRPVS